MPIAHQIPYAIRDRIEEAFVAFLRSSPELEGIDIVAASNREARVDPLHIFVSCVEARPQLAFGPLFKAIVQIVIVSNIDDSGQAERRGWVEAVMSHLTSADTYDYTVQVEDTEPTLFLMGWAIQSIQDVSQGQQTGDVIPIIVGVLMGIGSAIPGTPTTE